MSGISVNTDFFLLLAEVCFYPAEIFLLSCERKEKRDKETELPRKYPECDDHCGEKWDKLT
jgi:hypothetical protein